MVPPYDGELVIADFDNFITTDAKRAVVLGDDVQVPLGVKADLLLAPHIVESKFVVANRLDGGPIFFAVDRVGRQVLAVEDRSDHNRTIRIPVDKTDKHFHSNMRSKDMSVARTCCLTPSKSMERAGPIS